MHDHYLLTEYANVLIVQGKLGVLQLSLCYQPASETITIVIMKARDLKAKDINGLSGNMINKHRHLTSATKLSKPAAREAVGVRAPNCD